MIARLTALENEQSEDDEERREGLAVFDVDDRFQVLTDEKLAHENQSDVKQRPKGSETCFERNLDNVACGREVFVLSAILFALVGPTNADLNHFFDVSAGLFKAIALWKNRNHGLMGDVLVVVLVS